MTLKYRDSAPLRRGISSAVFQSDGKVVLRKEQFMISVIGPNTTCRESLNTFNVPAFYHESRSLIGYATHYLSQNR